MTCIIICRGLWNMTADIILTIELFPHFIKILWISQHVNKLPVGIMDADMNKNHKIIYLFTNNLILSTQWMNKQKRWTMKTDVSREYIYYFSEHIYILLFWADSVVMLTGTLGSGLGTFRNNEVREKRAGVGKHVMICCQLHGEEEIVLYDVHWS